MIKKVLSKKVNKLRKVTFATSIEEYAGPISIDDESSNKLDHEPKKCKLKEISNVFQSTSIHMSETFNSKNKLERSRRNSFTSLCEYADNYYKTKR